ncbi:MAG TPA: FG-GAP repeat protein [Thermoanaerobaculia bacterium]|nr:FG-GAP repeat protein [Thermoanaerobaculia bacterium]
MSSRRRVLLSVLTGVISAAIAGAQGLDASRGVPPAAREAISRAIGSDISIFQEAKLGSTANASLGISVAISGDTLVAGAPYAQPAAAYVFVKPASGWADTTTFAAKLTASDGVTDDGFGSSVAILGDTVVVGATQFNIGSKGAAYVFVKPASGWKSTSAFTAKLTASGGFNSDAFGSQVAISANTIFVGASDARVGANAGQGAVYVFEEPGTGWATTSTFTARLTVAGGHADDELGSSLAVSGDTVVAGSPGFGSGFEAGYVFVEPVSGWASTTAFDAKLTVPDSVGNVGFGQSVALSEDTIVVGALYARIGSNHEQGAAFVFEKPPSGWESTSAFDAELAASDGNSSDYFGASVALSGRIVAVGAPLNAGSSPFPGSAYVFVKPAGGWTTTSAFDAKLRASDTVGADSFGGAIAISDGTLAVGASGAAPGGAVYLFGGLPSPCDPGRLCVAPVAFPPAEPVDPRTP